MHPDFFSFEYELQQPQMKSKPNEEHWWNVSVSEDRK